MPPKRKSAPAASSSSNSKSKSNASPEKKPRLTLDAFFSPKVPVYVNAGINSFSGGGGGGDNRGKEREREKVCEVVLSDEQRGVLRMVVEEERSVFFTGSAGTGKSLLLRAIITALRKKHAKKNGAVSVTASTGMAASNIGGMTIHSWGAISPMVEDVEKLIRDIRTARPALQRWKETKVLVIDEISMVDGHLFERICRLAERLRKATDKPFGGIQLVVTGDFFQLPPVTKGNEVPFFAFECEAWKKCIQNTVMLNKVFRQKDNQFVDLLNELRHGNISPKTTAAFRALSRPLPTTSPSPSPSPSLSPSSSTSSSTSTTTTASTTPATTPSSSSTSTPSTQPTSSTSTSTPLPLPLPTELFPLRREVETANTTRLSSLPFPPHTYTSRDSGSAPPERRKKVLEGMIVPEKVILKVGAQVMLCRNVEEGRGLVNGAVGRVVGFFRSVTGGGKKEERVVRDLYVREDGEVRWVGDWEGKENVKPESGRGKTKVEGDVKSDKPESTTSARVKGEKPESTTSTSAKGKAKEKISEELYPLVDFSTQQGRVTGLVTRDEFRVEDNEGNVLARRVQIPLILAWAISIHKSQGQTIQRVKIDLGRVFEKGQSYVALSRAASMEGLQVLRFDPNRVKAHPKVIEWSKTLTTLGGP